jgi:hypothetical protein
MLTTAHLTNDRVTRINAIRELIGFGKPVCGFKVDNHHRNGAEYHLITSTALILIFNYNSKKLITVLIARPNQIKRYYDNSNKVAPEELINLAYEHTKKHYNNL